MSALYFHIGAVLVLVFLIVSVADRKMKSGAAGKCFLLLLIITFATTVCDMISVSMNVAAKAGRLPNLFLLYLFNTLYLLLHNLTIPIYMLFAIALTNTWHKLKCNKPMIAAMTIPSLGIVLALLVNLFTGKIFYFDAEHVYHRGDFMLILYVLASINMVVCAVYLFKYKKFFSSQKFIALISMLPLEFIAVIIQWFVPDLLVEMFANAVALFLVLTTVQRPEEIQESVTMLKNFNAYATDMRQDISNKKPFTTIIINISNFVALHQILGYDGANELLKITAEKLSEIDAELKTRAQLYHIQKGRFRFVVCGEQISMAETAAERINEELRKSINVSGLGLNLLAYVCITNCPGDIGDLQTLLRFGIDIHERLPYNGQVLRASELVGKQGFELGSVLDEIIDKAIANRGFKIYYQPIYSIAEKKFVSAEALLRLKDETYGFISPELFIVAAERSGAIHKIGDYVMDEVCRFIASDEYKKLGLEYIEVNLSVAQCMSPDLAEKILHIMRRHNVSPDSINLEITETAMSYAQNTMTENIQRLYDAGLSFSLDDYGTGYSNINRVASLPLKIVKLDKSFVDSEGNPKMWIVLQNTVKMIKDMDMHIVVEGIETKQVLEKFAGLKCDYIQGYYFSKPIPEEEFVEFILANMKK
ncbi:MAG: EAL domain-containing protein [Oscillospiraceae bacterium]|nr:EAL domain-containing protein [Oscillospiraceae bacterium]